MSEPSNAKLIEDWKANTDPGNPSYLVRSGYAMADRLAAYGDVTPEDVRGLLDACYDARAGATFWLFAQADKVLAKLPETDDE
jgi:hypothetical protein